MLRKYVTSVSIAREQMEADQHMFKTVQRKSDEPHRPRRYNDMKSTSKQVSTVDLTKFRKDFVTWSCRKWDTIAQIKKSYNQLHFTIVNKFKIWYCKTLNYNGENYGAIHLSKIWNFDLLRNKYGTLRKTMNFDLSCKIYGF